jgi:serine/threonine protein phosphatase PrpC
MPRFKVTACTAEHIGDRAEQQDRVAIVTSPRHPDSLLAVVSDGMGGRTGGRMAADQVIATVTHVFRDMGEDDAGSLQGLLQTMAAEAHTVIRLSGLSSEKEPHATFVALIVRSDYAVWAHAGDSRLYHFRLGHLLHRTEDQTYASYLRAQGRERQAIEADTKFKHMLVSSLGLTRPPTQPPTRRPSAPLDLRLGLRRKLTVPDPGSAPHRGCAPSTKPRPAAWSSTAWTGRGKSRWPR